MTPIQLTHLLRGTYAAAPVAAATIKAEGPAYQVWLTNQGGYIVLNWTAASVGNHDYVALYAPGADTTNPYGYMANQWQWASKGSPYQTGTYSDPGYVGVYWSWDIPSGSYKSLAVSPQST